ERNERGGIARAGGSLTALQNVTDGLSNCCPALCDFFVTRRGNRPDCSRWIPRLGFSDWDHMTAAGRCGDDATNRGGRTTGSKRVQVEIQFSTDPQTLGHSNYCAADPGIKVPRASPRPRRRLAPASDALSCRSKKLVARETPRPTILETDTDGARGRER